MPNGNPYFNFEKAEKLYAPFADTIEHFIQEKGLDPLGWGKWYHDNSVVHLGTDLDTVGFNGVRRRLKTFIIVVLDFPIVPDKLWHYLDIAWRVVCSVKSEELFSSDGEWQEDSERQRAFILDTEDSLT
jgi:hypothetical protein